MIRGIANITWKGLASIGLALILFVLLLQIRPVRTALINSALRWGNPYTDGLLRIGDSDGNVISSLSLSDLELIRTDGSVPLHLGDLSLRYRLLSALAGRIHFTEVRLNGLRLQARRDSAGVLDLLAPFAPNPDSPGIDLTLDTLIVSASAASVADTSGLWGVDKLELTLSQLTTKPSLSLKLEGLEGELLDPVTHLPGAVLVAAEITDGALRIDTLLYATSRSRVSARGTLADIMEPMETSDFELELAPLHFDDIRPLVPALIPGGALSLSVAITGRDGAALLDLAGDIGNGTFNGKARLDSTSIGGQLLFEGLDLSRVVNDLEAQPGTGAAGFDLNGPDWSHLTGTSRVSIDSISVAGISIANLLIEQSWDHGAVALTGQAVINSGLTRLSGTIWPGNPDLPISLRAQLLDWPVQSWTEKVSGAASATIDIDGTIANLSLHASINGSRIGDCALSGALSGTRIEGALVAQLDLGVCGGTLRGQGGYVMETGEWTLPSLVLSNVHPAQAVEDTIAATLSLHATGHGSLRTSTIRLAMTQSNYGMYRLDSLNAVAELEEGSWQARGALFSGPGEAAFSVVGDSLVARIDSLSFHRLDLTHTAGITGFESSLSGILSGTLTEGRSDLSLALRSSRINRQWLKGGVSTVTVIGSSLVTDGAIRLLNEGGIGWHAQANTAQGTAVLDALTFTELNIAALSPQVPIRSRLSGTLTGEIGVDRQLGQLVLEPGTINGLPVGGGGAFFSVDPDSAWARSRLLLGDGILRLEARLDPKSERYDGRVDITRLDAVRLAGVDTIRSGLSGTVRFSGHSLAVSSAKVNVIVDSLRFGFGDIRVDSMSGGLKWAEGILSSESMDIHGSPVRAHFQGSVPITDAAADQRYALTGELSVDDVTPIALAMGLQLATSGASFRVRGSGEKNHLQVSTSGAVTGLRYGDIHIARSDVLISMELGAGLTPTAAEARLDGRVLSLPGIAAEKADILLTVARDSLSVSTNLTISENRVFSLEGSAPKTLGTATIQDFQAQLDDAHWSLANPVHLLLEDGVEISGFLAVADSQRIALGGYVGTQDGDDLFFSGTSVRLDAVADIMGLHDLGVTLDTRLSLTSNGPDSERAINGVLSGLMTYEDANVGSFDGRISLMDHRLSMDLSLDHNSGHSATARGYVPFSLSPFDLSDQPVSLVIDSDRVPINWARAFVDPTLMDRLEGQFSSAVSVRGTYAAPTLSGVASLTQGRMGLPDLGKPRQSLIYESANLYLSLHDEVIVLDSASVRSGRGRASATGSIALTHLALGQMEIDLSAQDFLAIDSAPYRAIVSAQMQLSGTTAAPKLGGSVRVAQAQFMLTDETSAAAFEPVTLDRRDLLTLEERFGLRVTEADTTNFDFYEAMEIDDLSVELDRNTWLRSPRNPSVDIQFTGNMDVSKLPNQDVQVFGVIDVVTERSQIEQFGRRFDIEQGTMTFNGPPEQPNMDIAAVYRVRSRGSGGDEVTIQLEASGFPDDITISFQSDPAMELSDIVSYIATGRPASESLQLGATSSNDYLKSAAGLAVGPITSLVENLAGAGLGLDVVKIEQDETNGLTLTAGKYVSPRLFVSVSQPISLASSSGTSTADATQVAMEYEIFQHVLVSLLSRGTVVQTNLRWERSF